MIGPFALNREIYHAELLRVQIELRREYRAVYLLPPRRQNQVPVPVLPQVKFSGTVADGTFRSLGRNGRAGPSADLYLNTSKLCVKLPALATKSQCPTLIQNEPYLTTSFLNLLRHLPIKICFNGIRL